MQDQTDNGNKNTPQIDQNQIDSLPSIQKTRKTHYGKISAVLLLLAIAAGLIFFLMQSQQDNRINTKVETKLKSVPLVVKPGFKGYINKVYGYAFAYPENFIFDDLDAPPVDLQYVRVKNVEFRDNPSAKYKQVVVGHTAGVNKETCKSNSDLFTPTINGYSNRDPAKYDYKKITSTLMGAQVDGIFIQAKMLMDPLPSFNIQYFVEYPLCVNNKFFEIKFQYRGYTAEEADVVYQDAFRSDILSSFTLLDKSELEIPEAKDPLSVEEHKILDRFNAEIVSLNASIKSELSDKQITQIFNLGDTYVIRTVPKGFIQGPTYQDEGAVNIYAVDKSSFATIVKEGHDITFIDGLTSPAGLENKRLIVQIGGGAHVSDLILLDITSGIKILKFSDKKNYSAKVEQITKIPFINIREDGSMHAEQYSFEGNTLKSILSDVAGEWDVIVAIDLLSGEITNVRIEKNSYSENDGQMKKTEVVFDN